MIDSEKTIDPIVIGNNKSDMYNSDFLNISLWRSILFSAASLVILGYITAAIVATNKVCMNKLNLPAYIKVDTPPTTILELIVLSISTFIWLAETPKITGIIKSIIRRILVSL